MVKKIVTFVGIGLFIIILSSGIFFWILSGGTKYSNKLFSPDGKYSTQVVEINSGATTEYTTVVSIVDEKSFFANFDFLNVWIGAKIAVFGFNGLKSSVEPLWINNRTLKISYSNCKRIKNQRNAWRDIKIVYDRQCQN